jgi:hypothetical protein
MNGRPVAASGNGADVEFPGPGQPSGGPLGEIWG